MSGAAVGAHEWLAFKLAVSALWQYSVRLFSSVSSLMLPACCPSSCLAVWRAGADARAHQSWFGSFVEQSNAMDDSFDFLNA